MLGSNLTTQDFLVVELVENYVRSRLDVKKSLFFFQRDPPHFRRGEGRVLITKWIASSTMPLITNAF